MPGEARWSIAAPATGQPGTTVWHVDLDAVTMDDPGWLSLEEAACAARFLRRSDREQYIRSHLALRWILAGSLGCRPAALQFRSDTGGRPELAGPNPESLRFNLSHSGSHALIGLSQAASIGVDVEVVRPLDDAMRIATTYFHGLEAADLMQRSERDRNAAFFACWTRKEAVVKALGAGLALPLDGFQVSLPPAPAALIQAPRVASPPPGWSMHHLDLGPDAVGAVAITRAGEPCARFRLAPFGEASGLR